jgi:hypothetical protein
MILGAKRSGGFSNEIGRAGDRKIAKIIQFISRFTQFLPITTNNSENILVFQFQPLPLPSEILNGLECLQYSN